jgi:predicted porin
VLLTWPLAALTRLLVALVLANKDFQAIASNVLNNGNSRFGLKGVEDLGGGMKAGFNFEGGQLGYWRGNTSGYTAGDAALGVNSGWLAVNCSPAQLTCTLQGGFGRLTAGRQLTTSFFSVASWELTGTANYSVVANQFGFGGVAPT